MNIFEKYKGKKREEIPDDVWELILTVGNIQGVDRELVGNPDYYKLPTSPAYGRHSDMTKKEIKKNLNKFSKEFINNTRKPYES